MSVPTVMLWRIAADVPRDANDPVFAARLGSGVADALCFLLFLAACKSGVTDDARAP